MEKNDKKPKMLFRAVMLMALYFGTATLCIAQEFQTERGVITIVGTV